MVVAGGPRASGETSRMKEFGLRYWLSIVAMILVAMSLLFVLPRIVSAVADWSGYSDLTSCRNVPADGECWP